MSICGTMQISKSNTVSSTSGTGWSNGSLMWPLQTVTGNPTGDPLRLILMPSAEATVGQAASAVVPVQKTVDGFLEQVKQECVETNVEPGVVADVNLATAVYDVKLEGTQTPPVFDTDEEEAGKSGGDRDVSIEGVSDYLGRGGTGWRH